MTVGETTVKEGEWISVDGTTGKVFIGKIPTTSPSLEKQTELLTLLKWADEICARKDIRDGSTKGYPTRGLQVWANADYPKDARRARSYGAVGIGLCRTEHMFFEPERLPIVQDMILSDTSEGRTSALDIQHRQRRAAMVAGGSFHHVDRRAAARAVHDLNVLPQLGDLLRRQRRTERVYCVACRASPRAMTHSADRPSQ